MGTIIKITIQISLGATSKNYNNLKLGWIAIHLKIFFSHFCIALDSLRFLRFVGQSLVREKFRL